MAHHDPIGLIAPHAGLAQLNERSRDIFVRSSRAIRDRRTRRLAQYFPPDRGAAVAGFRPQRDVEPRAALGLIYAPHTSAGRLPTELGLRFFVDALMQVGDLTEPERESIQNQLASVGRAQIGRGGARRSADAAVRPHARRRRGADRQIQFAAEAYRIRAAGAGTCAGRAGRRRRPGRKPRAGAAARRSSSALTEATNFLNSRISRADACRSASRTRDRADAEPRRTRSVDAEGDRGRHRKLVRRRQ